MCHPLLLYAGRLVESSCESRLERDGGRCHISILRSVGGSCGTSNLRSRVPNRTELVLIWSDTRRGLEGYRPGKVSRRVPYVLMPPVHRYLWRVPSDPIIFTSYATTTNRRHSSEALPGYHSISPCSLGDLHSTAFSRCLQPRNPHSHQTLSAPSQYVSVSSHP